MTANELADLIECACCAYQKEAATMLRQFHLAESIIKQQQLEIEALKKQFAIDQTSPYLNELANLIKKQTKELSDEEILELSDKHLVLVNEYIGCGDYVSNIEGEIEFARAILRKAQEK